MTIKSFPGEGEREGSRLPKMVYHSKLREWRDRKCSQIRGFRTDCQILGYFGQNEESPSIQKIIHPKQNSIKSNNLFSKPICKRKASIAIWQNANSDEPKHATANAMTTADSNFWSYIK